MPGLRPVKGACVAHLRPVEWTQIALSVTFCTAWRGEVLGGFSVRRATAKDELTREYGVERPGEETEMA